MTPPIDLLLLDHLWERSHVVLLLAGPDGIIRRHNAEATRVFGTPLEGRTLESVLGPDPHPDPGTPRRVNSLVSEDRAETYYFLFMDRPEGRLAIGETDPEEIHRLRNDLSGSHTELSLLNRQLQKNAVELDRLNQLKNRFLGIAAHDLRNPLTLLYGHARILEKLAENGDATLKDSVSTILASTQYMLKLLDDLLDISHIESGKWNLEPKETDLVPWMDRLLDRYTPQAGLKNIRFERHYTTPLPPIRLDPMRFEQVMSNLISNAIKYSPTGTVTRVHLKEVDGGIEIAVTDQGPGIPAAEMSRLFEDFSRTSTRPTGGEKSTGLGLSIVRRIVEIHGGKVRADSIVGQGSTFTVWMPLDPPVLDPTG